jgi:activator of HSP90 ATPase
VINQQIEIKASPEKVYNALIIDDQFSEVTKAPAEISAEEGGKFNCFGGHIVGRHIELNPNKRIVQAWRAKSWDEGVYSIVRFEMTSEGCSTILTLVQVGFPDGSSKDLESGWHKMYWEPLKAYLE